MKNLILLKRIFSLSVVIIFLFGVCSNELYAQSTSPPPLSPDFTGIWESVPSKKVIINSSEMPGYLKVIRLRLCVENGTLEGIITHSRIKGLEKFEIDSQEVISSSQVNLGLKDRLGREASLTLFL